MKLACDRLYVGSEKNFETLDVEHLHDYCVARGL
jgi:hypothetical protein